MAKNTQKAPRSHADSLSNRIALVVRQSICQEALDRRARGGRLYWAKALDHTMIQTHYYRCLNAKKFTNPGDGGYRLRATIKRVMAWYKRLMALDEAQQLVRTHKEVAKIVDDQPEPETHRAMHVGSIGGHAARRQPPTRGYWWREKEERAAA